MREYLLTDITKWWDTGGECSPGDDCSCWLRTRKLRVAKTSPATARGDVCCGWDESPPANQNEETSEVAVGTDDLHRAIWCIAAFSPLAWWKIRDAQFPTITKLAQKYYLAIPASSTPTEQVFSRAKLIHQHQWWSFLPQCLEVCTMLKHDAWLISGI